MYKRGILQLLYTCITCFVLSIFAGCAQSPTHDSKNVAYIYGEGSGANFEMAKQRAIQDLATNLQVSVKYSMQQQTRQNNQSLQTSGMSNMQLESKIKDIPSIEVVSTTKKGNITNVRVRVLQSVLEGAIHNRIQAAQQQLYAMLETCDAIPFKQHRAFKKTLQELQGDIALYRSLTKDMSYGNAALSTFQESVAELPTYAVVWELSELGEHEREVQTILNAEMSKFIKINGSATRTIHVQTNTDDVVRFFLRFSDCKNNPENTIQINTHIKKHAIANGAQRARLGAVIYKGIEASY